MDPALLSQAIVVVALVVIALGSRFTDSGRRKARRLRAAEHTVDVLRSSLSEHRRLMYRHNEQCPTQIMIPPRPQEAADDEDG
ncbi:hypothetical protein DT076_16540 [Desertihabitans brevis]|uniref:Uncharacterized protein n=1 Tax=Desertihabitans brevis TaxID=2268447 RepID=A0A367YQT9_9ACTN|nr:hypothetical protein [Desertihabitans brevis]RCK68256.1 hypothetical protein DT076_16540 [Desertihabitans brevis]